MICTLAALACLLSSICLWGCNQQRRPYPSYSYDIARTHEIEPHRGTILLEGAPPGERRLRLTLTVSPTGDVTDAQARGEPEVLKFWPQVQGEVRQWKFTPFEENGKAVTAEVEEFLALVPAERLPKNHVTAPVLQPNSKLAIALTRTQCYGDCPAYTVTVSTDGIVFDGQGYVVASGRHRDRVDTGEVRKLAQRFIDADFYSMDSIYSMGLPDSSTYILSIAIDGHTKKVEDYVGSVAGMPAVISKLEGEVDALARTQRWVEGNDGLVQALQAEKFNFHTFAAQVMLKEAASRGKAATVREFLKSGVPLEPLLAPKLKEPYMGLPFKNMRWLTAASNHPEVLEVLTHAAASKNDQSDKDLALAAAVDAGNLEAARALIAYGANPNADLSRQIVTMSAGRMTVPGPGAGSVLIYAAASGSPEMVREILGYHPKLEKRDHEGKTAVFAAGESRYGDKDGARAECVRLLAQAGADINARDHEGNTPLHEIFVTEVEEELLRLGANVNARNKDGETPIFTTSDHDAIPLLIQHGADLAIRNNQGQTVMEAAIEKDPARQEDLRKAIEKLKQR